MAYKYKGKIEEKGRGYKKKEPPVGKIEEKGRGYKKKKKKYTKADTGSFARSKKAMTSDKAYALPFGETFRQAKAKGEKTFRWKSKQYHTKTKEELEKVEGAKEKERFDRAAKSKATTKKRTLREKLTGYSTQAGYEEARAARRKAKIEEKKAKRKAK